MVGWHHGLNGHGFEQTPEVSEGQDSLAFCSEWGHKESDMTQRLNNIVSSNIFCLSHLNNLLPQFYLANFSIFFQTFLISSLAQVMMFIFLNLLATSPLFMAIIILGSLRFQLPPLLRTFPITLLLTALPLVWDRCLCSGTPQDL